MASQPSTTPGSFDPAAWLAAFTAIGGGYALMSGRQIAFIVDPDNEAAASVVAEVTNGSGRLDAVRMMIERRQNGETVA